MTKRYRMILLLCTFVVLQIIGFTIEGSFANLLNSFWYTSGFILLVLLSLVDQPFFSKDSNIFVNAITASLSLLIVPTENHDSIFYFLLVCMIYLLVSSYWLMVHRSRSLKEEDFFIQLLSRLNRTIGKPEVIFSVFFLWGAIYQYTISSLQFSSLFLFWTIFILLNHPRLAQDIEDILNKQRVKLSDGIGVILGVQSQNSFLVKVDRQIKSLGLFSFVEMKYSVDDRIYRGLIYEMMLLDQEQWIKVITNSEIENLFNKVNYLTNYKKDVVYLMEDPSDKNILNSIVGIVTEESEINKIKFLYNSKVKVVEGNLLETTVHGQKVIFQIIEGITKVEQLSDRNQSGFIIGEAIQLGIWNNTEYKFDKFGWVPEINNPLYLASSSSEYNLENGEFVIGELPDTNFPVIINKELAITHHMAVVGVTGTGKSVFSRNLIRQHLQDDNVKVICVDFTGEYMVKFEDLKPTVIINDEDSLVIREAIDKIEKEKVEFPNNRRVDLIDECKRKIYTRMKSSIEVFLQGDIDIAVFELPDVQNTSGVMYYTMTFIRTLFQIAKEQDSFDNRVCLVLEEAHTVIPEWTFIGTTDKNTQAVLNSIAQIALQGRKYNIGLLIIAQRTANVSKTILTQCNSIVSFQQFDDTSINFLANYLGNDIASSLASLQFRQAVATGKAFKSSVPMIFNVPEISEELTSDKPAVTEHELDT